MDVNETVYIIRLHLKMELFSDRTKIDPFDRGENSLNKGSLTASVKLPLINFNEPQIERKKMEKVSNEEYPSWPFLFFFFLLLIAFSE